MALAFEWIPNLSTPTCEVLTPSLKVLIKLINTLALGLLVNDLSGFFIACICKTSQPTRSAWTRPLWRFLMLSMQNETVHMYSCLEPSDHSNETFFPEVFSIFCVILVCFKKIKFSNFNSVSSFPNYLTSAKALFALWSWLTNRGSGHSWSGNSPLITSDQNNFFGVINSFFLFN